MDAARKKGAAVTNRKLEEIRRIVELGKRAAIGKTWDEKLDYYAGRIVSEKKESVRMAYEKLHHQAMDCKHKYKAGGKMIALLVEMDGQITKWQHPAGERPEPTAFNGEEQGFQPPREEAG